MIENKKDFCIGIDLGTTFTCCAVWIDSEVRVIPNDNGNRTTPSFISFIDNGIKVGDESKNMYDVENKKNMTIYDAKRLIGRTFDDPVIQNDIKHYAFNVINKDNKPYIKIFDKEYPPEYISAQLLSYIKKCAENFVGGEIKNAVITVPAYFNDQQRTSTRNAGIIAGLNVMKIINEPTAAAIAYGFGVDDGETTKNILVFDYGGGTLDVSILNISENKFTVLSTNGDTHLGGEDIDNNIVDYCMKEIVKKHKQNISKNSTAMRKLKNKCEKAKIILSTSLSTTISLEGIIENDDGEIQISRARLEDLCYDMFERLKIPIKKALDDAKLDKNKIDQLVLIGGSSKIPKVRDILVKYFEGIKLNMRINPDEAVAYGAAVQGAKLLNITEDKIEDLKIKDITPLSLGVETYERDEMVMSVIINRNTPIPAKMDDYYSTWKDDQECVSIKIYEGERRYTKDNHYLGTFDLKGISKKPKGIPKIKITFEVNNDGILIVTAVDEESGKDKKLIVEKSTSISTQEIKNMIDMTEKYKEIDNKKKELDENRYMFMELFNLACTTITSQSVIAKIPIDYFEKIRNITNNDEYKKMKTNKDKFTIIDYQNAIKEIKSVIDTFVPIIRETLSNISENKLSVKDID